MKKKAALMLLALVAVSGGAWAGDYGFWEPYTQRTEGITAGAGDAKEVNSAIQAIDPWPAYVRNRHIPGSGERMSHAIRRYQDVTKLKEAAPAITPDPISASGIGGGQASGK
jgi:hypothetical protein